MNWQRLNKAVIAVLLTFLGFLAGHACSSYQVQTDLFPTLQRFQALHNASLMLRSVETLDTGETAALRAKLLAVAQSELEPLPAESFSWWVALRSPLMNTADDTEAIRAKNEASVVSLRSKLASLAAREKAPE
jgi:hypothetical protein